MDHVIHLNGPRVRASDADARDDALFPDDRITCGGCVRLVNRIKNDPNRCPRGRFPADMKHRCWYFKAKPDARDRRPGCVRYASSDEETRRQLGYTNEMPT